MSDCGGFIIGCLALPLVLVTLLVAGVAYAALQAARLVGSLAAKGLQVAGTTLLEGGRLAGSALAWGVREVAPLMEQALVSAGNTLLRASEGAQRAAQSAGTVGSNTLNWAGNLFESNQVVTRLRNRTRSAYNESLTALSGQFQTASAAPVTTSVAPTGTLLGTQPPIVSLTGGLGKTTASVPAAPPSLPTQASAAVQQVARAQAVRSALDAELPIRLVAQRWYADKLAEGDRLVQQSQRLLREGDAQAALSLAQQAEAFYTTTTHDAHRRLVTAERTTTAVVVGNTLQDLGYSVRVAAKGEAVAMVGRKQHQTLAVVVRPGGHLEMDMAGFSGDACHLESQALLAGLRKNGLMIAEANIRRHGSFKGGAIIRRAQRHGKSLEEALVEIAALPEDVEEDAPVRRQVVISNNDERLRQAQTWLWQNNSTVQSRGGRA